MPRHPAPRQLPPQVVARVPADAPYSIGFYLVPGFPLMAFASAIEPLRAANRLSGLQLFEWRLYSRDGAPVRASNGIDIAVHGSARERTAMNLLLVCAGTPDAGDETVFKWLRSAVRGGAALGGISLGAYVLAHAGLLLALGEPRRFRRKVSAHPDDDRHLCRR